METEWRDYRRGLSTDEQVAFDALFRHARAHASASMNAGRADPLEAILVSVLLEHEKTLRRLAREEVAAPPDASRTCDSGSPAGRSGV